MNENINLTKILKNCPVGWKFWSPLLGNVEFHYIGQAGVRVKTVKGDSWELNQDGTAKIGADIASPEIMLYPSKEQKDWSKFTAPWYKKDRFDPKTLKPFDKVLVNNNLGYKWGCDLFSYIINKNIEYKYCCISSYNKYCIPYNDDTKHILNTTNLPPEYYRYWED